MRYKSTTLLALFVSALLLSCSSSRESQTQTGAQPAVTPVVKKSYYFLGKSKDKGLSSLKPELGESTNAERVEGEIKGQIVQRSSGQEKTKEGKYIYTYFVAEGKDIEMIDENGLYKRAGTNLVVLAANLEKADVTDLELLQTGMATKATTAPSLKLPSGGTVGHFTLRTEKQAPVPMKLLGEFRPGQDKGQLIPALEVSTDQGVVTIPVDQLIPFKKKAEQPTPAAK